MHTFIGKHIFGELYGINSEKINSIDYLETVLTRGVTNSNATICGTLIKKFVPQGLSVLILLSESHVSVHTYPENNSIFFDIFTCGTKCCPEKFVDELIRELNPCNKNIKIIERGITDESEYE